MSNVNVGWSGLDEDRIGAVRLYNIGGSLDDCPVCGKHWAAVFDTWSEGIFQDGYRAGLEAAQAEARKAA